LKEPFNERRIVFHGRSLSLFFAVGASGKILTPEKEPE